LATDAPTIEAEAPTAASPPAAAPVKAPAVKAKKDDAKAGKAKKETKGKKGAATVEDAGDGPSVAAHPRAARAVARAKGWGGLGGFLLGGYMSLPTGTLVEAGLRALLAGVVCYVAVWAGAVFVWRRLVILEIKAREQQLLTALQGAQARRELAGASAGPAGERSSARAA
jgi:hypothetical protein